MNKTGGTQARTRGRTVSPARRGMTAWLLAVPLCVCAPVRLVSQETVGNSPEHSPYHDIVFHQSLTLFAGRWAGNAGAAGVGALPGLALGGRLAVRLSGPVDFWLTFGQASSSRRTIIADTAVTHTDSARWGPNLHMPLVLGDLALALNLTGDKTWHGLAPYVGAGLGIVAATSRVLDPGGFQVGTNFAIIPTIGTRFFLSDALALRLEVRDYLFRYQYPFAYFDTLNLRFAGPPPRKAVLPLGTSDRQWANNLTLWAGVAYVFTF